MPEMTAPNGTTRNVPAAGVEALRALGWTGAEPEETTTEPQELEENTTEPESVEETAPEPQEPSPEQPSSKPRARGSRASSKASKED